MFFESLRAKLAHKIAPEIRERHALALKIVLDNCKAQVSTAHTIRDNFQRTVERSNDQTEALYADAWLHLPDSLQRKWSALLGAPNMAVASGIVYDDHNRATLVKGIEVQEFHERAGI